MELLESDQTAAAPVGVHDAVLVDCPGDSMDKEGGEGQVLTCHLALPHNPLGMRNVDLHQTVDDVLPLGGSEEVV
jgi:hypothetical protein